MPKVTLVSHTPDPVELLFATEKYAKTTDENPYLTDVRLIANVRSAQKNPNVQYPWVSDLYDKDALYAAFPDLRDSATPWADYVAIVEEWALKVATMAIPIAEMVHFVFRLDDVTIALREQLVRHRTNSYWVQSGRITDNSKISDEGRYNVPESVRENEKLSEVWHTAWGHTQDAYQYLRDNGVPDEDCRELVGSGATHRLTMGVNLRSLIELLKHRTCYIAQGHWVEVVMQMVKAVSAVDPLFSVLGHPPCWDHNKKFTRCKYEGICQERHEGKDPHPVCPIWFGKEETAEDVSELRVLGRELRVLGRWDDERNKKFGKLWSKKDE
jgi:thymidylate synthase ThyX